MDISSCTVLCDINLQSLHTSLPPSNCNMNKMDIPSCTVLCGINLQSLHTILSPPNCNMNKTAMGHNGLIQRNYRRGVIKELQRTLIGQELVAKLHQTMFLLWQICRKKIAKPRSFLLSKPELIHCACDCRLLTSFGKPLQYHCCTTILPQFIYLNKTVGRDFVSSWKKFPAHSYVTFLKANHNIRCSEYHKHIRCIRCFGQHGFY